ncbi:hypothetical protein DPMN_073553 [Dreissena polymorpha]|uniref:Uncharacterized protein n=1 Tax=Dreissena polymorpha TaxID=45954 RepID=A0A9D4BZ84_DREPO|nr:hypothetical protein DPMN_073553 [Dreissena polymorpha]
MPSGKDRLTGSSYGQMLTDCLTDLTQYDLHLALYPLTDAAICHPLTAKSPGIYHLAKVHLPFFCSETFCDGLLSATSHRPTHCKQSIYDQRYN